MIIINNNQYICLLEYAIDLLKGKWKPIIICTLDSQTFRYNELYKIIDGISHKMLSEKLKELENERIVERTSYNEMPLRVEYKLTKTGLELYIILQQLKDWTVKYLEE